ncbi:MAG: TPM domain-containing protein [Acetatifactor sp.]|nr:TPM domain-containing protein [Acetatifactor sp.]
MGNDYKKEARRQYFKYFCGWFIAVGVLLIVVIAVVGVKTFLNNRPRGNNMAPEERVYDYADVLTDAEEEKLRSQIAKAEKKLRMDIVIVTIDQSVEGWEAAREYGYRSDDWEVNMQDLADDFWDENGYGYNKSYEGDGVLLLHNWYEDENGSQNGEHISTSGRAEDSLSIYDLDQILYPVDRYYNTDTYKAYSEFVNAVENRLDISVGFDFSNLLGAICPSTIVAFIYAIVNLRQSKAKDTTAVNAYVVGGKPVMNAQRDELLRKSVTKRHISTSSGGGGGGGSSHSGGGGHHHSSSGASHGGTSHRH